MHIQQDDRRYHGKQATNCDGAVGNFFSEDFPLGDSCFGTGQLRREK
ncbi:MAG: hypothetical protein ACK54E_19480 [Pseudanabaena sp.]